MYFSFIQMESEFPKQPSLVSTRLGNLVSNRVYDCLGEMTLIGLEISIFKLHSRINLTRHTSSTVTIAEVDVEPEALGSRDAMIQAAPAITTVSSMFE